MSLCLTFVISPAFVGYPVHIETLYLQETMERSYSRAFLQLVLMHMSHLLLMSSTTHASYTLQDSFAT